jgi:uncharacterized membrane protein YhaH (DUF805 family)
MVTVTERAARGRTFGPRAVAVLESILVGGYLVAMAMFAWAYADADGDTARLLGGYFDPKDYVPGGMHLVNPLAYVFTVATLSVLIGWLYGIGLLLAAVPLLVLRRGRVPGRTWWWLLVATVAVAALVAMTFTPFGADLGRWIAD